MKLTGRVALITGASHGLGLAIAHQLAAEGATLALVARRGESLDRAAAELAFASGGAAAFPADVSAAAEVETSVRAVIERWGRIDILVLNAGTWQGAPLAETDEAMWDRLIDLNLKGAFLTLKAATPWLIAGRRGATVVGICSLGGWVGQPGSAAYAASKWGLRGLLESAALELKPHRVRVSIVSPHNMNSAGRAIAPDSQEREQNLEPADVASLVAWICTAPDYVSVGNATIWPLSAGIRGR
jgi:NAD(P)-dependent dehydrogenase (short-subunit alcohol dehydrogenase family)